LPENNDPAKAKICKENRQRLAAFCAGPGMVLPERTADVRHGKWSATTYPKNRIDAI
jgi:hypothetical protein